MKRNICQQCNRPQSVCLCELIQPIDNRISVTIYRHTSEIKKAVGTAALTALSLKNCTIIDTDVVVLSPVDNDNTVSNHSESDKSGGKYRVLLFPPMASPSLGLEDAEIISTSELASRLATQSIELLVLDGTWKKARKMYYLSPCLHTLPKLSLVINPQQANYTIRKAEKPGQLSTLEAIAAAQGEIENNTEKYKPLLALQQGMVDQQLALMSNKVKCRYE